MLSTFGLRDEDAALFKNFYEEVTANFHAEIINDLKVPFEKFELFKNYKHIAYYQAIQINNNFGKAYLAIVQVKYEYTAKRGESGLVLEYQIWGAASFEKNFGHLFIKPETITDKVIELFHPIELDFADDKDFSKRFFVLTKDEQKASYLLTQSFRNALRNDAPKHFQLEVLNDSLIIGENKSLGNCDIRSLGNFLCNITNTRI